VKPTFAALAPVLAFLALLAPLRAQEGAPAQPPAQPPSRESAQESAPSVHEVERQQALRAAFAALVKGPAKLAFLGQATLELPEGFGWIPQAPAGRLMKSVGNSVDAGFQGLVVPQTADGTLHVYEVSWSPAGYVKDDDARDWKADALLSDIREGAEEGNKRRREIGTPEIAITGWIEEPRYDASTHKLVWSVGLREKASAGADVDGLNYQTLVLGREGYLAMILLTDPRHVDELRPATNTLLAALSFNEGKRYADFQSGTDHVAEFGLAALVAGVAAKKLGLIAVLVAFAIKFAKVLVVGALAVLVGVKKWLGMRSRPAPAPASAAESGTNSVLSGDAVQGNTIVQPTVVQTTVLQAPPPPDAGSRPR
jgi:uncharacterized membrane-anchored protein